MKSFLTCLALLLVTCLTGPALAQGSAGNRPNIVVVLADDMGWGDLACYGNPIIKTPNLDKFASQGVKFTSGYSACAVCSPSRSAILTGRAPLRNGVINWIAENREMHLRTSEVTIATLLKQAGYDTCHAGKWHLNGKFNSPEQPQPNDHGFNHWMATQNNAAPNHKNPVNFVRNGQPVGPMQGFSAPLMADEAIHWLKQKRDRGKPFFINVWTHEPHLPIESDEQFMKLYPDKSPDEQQHHGNVTQADHAFGKLMAALDEMGLAENTLVFFTSDNGPEGNGTTARTRGFTGGLRGRKRDVYEGGVRVPFLVRWPGRTQPGTVIETPVIGSDIFATIADATGVKPPTDRVYDGVSILPLLSGGSITRTKPLFYHCTISPSEFKFGMRQGDYKIVANRALDNFEMYNLKADWQETKNLAAAEPQRFEAMKREIAALVKEMESDTPRFTDMEDWRKPGPQKKAGAEPKKKKKQESK